MNHHPSHPITQQPTATATIPKRWASAGYSPHPPPGLSASCDIPRNEKHPGDELVDLVGTWMGSGDFEAHLGLFGVASWGHFLGTSWDGHWRQGEVTGVFLLRATVTLQVIVS